MIQRIQTVFLLIAALALSMQGLTPMLKSSFNSQSGVFQDGVVYLNENFPSLIVLALTVLLSLTAIFLFNNRKIQKQLVILIGFLVMADNLFSGYYFLPPTQSMIIAHASIRPGIGALMPVLGILSLILAYRGIQKDDKIVKSMDRLR